MTRVVRRWAILTLLLDAACGSGESELVGTWQWSGNTGPVTEAFEMSFAPDGTAAFVSQLEPNFRPASVPPPAQAPGFDPESCFPTTSVHATYREVALLGENRLSWTFAEGTKDRVAGCSDPALNSPGAATDAAEISAFIAQGWLPPTQLTFTVDENSLLIRSRETNNSGIARSAGTTFTRVR